MMPKLWGKGADGEFYNVARFQSDFEHMILPPQLGLALLSVDIDMCKYRYV